MFLLLGLILFVPKVYAFTYELDTGDNSYVAKRLNNLRIYWIKAKPIAYKSDIIRHYIPDFYLPLTNEYIEVKGRYTDTDKLKMKLVVE